MFTVPVSRRCHHQSEPDPAMSSPRKVVHSRGTSFEITYRIHTRMVRRRFPTRAAALDAMAEARTQIRAGTHLAPVEARITLAAYAARWIAGLQVAQSTGHVLC
jgi:hypothetical protein